MHARLGVGARAGDSYGSPEGQEAAARACASRFGLEIGEVVLEENVSGEAGALPRRLASKQLHRRPRPSLTSRHEATRLEPDHLI